MTTNDKGSGGNMPCKAPASINVYHLLNSATNCVILY